MASGSVNENNKKNEPSTKIVKKNWAGYQDLQQTAAAGVQQDAANNSSRYAAVSAQASLNEKSLTLSNTKI